MSSYNCVKCRLIESISLTRIKNVPFLLDGIVKSSNQAKQGHHWKQKRQAPHKFLEVALVADNFAISAYGEEKMVDHLLTVAHIVCSCSIINELVN